MVIEFLDSNTGHLYSDDDTKNPYKPALRGSIADDNWDKNKTVNYMLSIDESFTLTIEPVGKKLDAHYVIGYANVTVEGIDNWTIEVSSDVSSAEPITIQPEEEVNLLAKQGFWTDKVVDANGNVTAASARGSESWSGTGNVTNKLFYIFIPENVSDKDRQISLTLRGTGASTVSTTKVLLQKYPNWTDGGFGWEVVDDDESGEYGFKWTRKVVYQFYQNHGEIFKIGTSWTGYERDQMLEFINAIVAPYNNGNALTVGASDSWIYLAETEVNSFSIFGYKVWVEYKMNVHIDYTKLNNITTALSETDGLANSKALYQLGGSAATSSLETVLQESTKTENTDPAFTIISQDGSLNDLSGILTYIQKKNKYNMQIVTTEVATTPHPIFNVDDLKWYLPAYGQFQYFTPDPNIAGDDKSHYWSSTAVSGSSEAYIGDGTPKDRDLQYRVIAVRKNDN